jgi:hypothetical protein
MPSCTLVRTVVGCVLSVLGLVGLPAAAGAQPATPAPALKVFPDCTSCDSEYLRQNVTFVEYVRDRTVADVHLLVTTRGTGGGGREWTLQFIGLGGFANQDRTLAFAMPQTATSDESRAELARVFRLGIVGYVAALGGAPSLDVTWRPETGGTPPPAADPWRHWVFRINGSANMGGEQRREDRSFFASASANRTTDRWKVQVSGNRNESRGTFELDDGRTIVSRSQSSSVNALVVKSLGPRWSVGGRSSASHSSFSNIDRSISLSPAIEFNIFPYSQSARRSLIFHYAVGATHYDYRAITVFDKTSETVPHHNVYVWLSLRQPWGSLTVYPSVRQHLNDPERFNMRFSANTDVRLFQGFSFNVSGDYSRIRDQISLPRAGASTEEVLLRLRQLETNYSYSVRVGLSYSFGSIFNSIVNTRFD